MLPYIESDLCCLTLNQLSVGIVFTTNGIIRFMNKQMKTWLNQSIRLSDNTTFSDIFKNQNIFLQALTKSQDLLNQTHCCCYTTQKSIFLTQPDRIFRIKSFRINPNDKFSDICWVFQDITPLILKRQFLS